MYKEIEGDLIQLALEGNFDAIAHGCNCFCRQVSGLAGQMAKTFHTNNQALFPSENMEFRGGIEKLGRIEWATYNLDKGKAIPTFLFDVDLSVINCYTQFYSKSTTPADFKGVRFDYEAFTICMRKINHIWKGRKVGLPAIGTGSAEGNWEKIIEILLRELKDCNVTTVFKK